MESVSARTTQRMSIDMTGSRETAVTGRGRFWSTSAASSSPANAAVNDAAVGAAGVGKRPSAAMRAVAHGEDATSTPVGISPTQKKAPQHASSFQAPPDANKQSPLSITLAGALQEEAKQCLEKKRKGKTRKEQGRKEREEKETGLNCTRLCVLAASCEQTAAAPALHRV